MSSDPVVSPPLWRRPTSGTAGAPAISSTGASSAPSGRPIRSSPPPGSRVGRSGGSARRPVADDPVVVVPYDPEWPLRFEAERALLERVLAPWLEGGIHHVGSTAVPGLASKPIVDMIAGVRSLEEARAAFAPLREHSYLHTPHRPGVAHHFSKPSIPL